MKYFLPDEQETIDDAREITGKYQPSEDHMAGTFAEDVAEYLYSCDPEWGDNLKISVVGSSGSVYTFKIHIDYDPTFYAEKL